jgi:hypothetical protein
MKNSTIPKNASPSVLTKVKSKDSAKYAGFWQLDDNYWINYEFQDGLEGSLRKDVSVRIIYFGLSENNNPNGFK